MLGIMRVCFIKSKISKERQQKVLWINYNNAYIEIFMQNTFVRIFTKPCSVDYKKKIILTHL